MKTEIKKCTLEDLHALQVIGTETYSETYSHLNTPENMNEYLESAFNLDQLKTELSNDNSTFLFLYVNQVLAGYLKVNVNDAQTYHVSDDALEIERIYVKHVFQDKGLGKMLLQTGINLAKEMNKKEVWLGVWQKNKNAIDFHKNMGFETRGKYSYFIGDEEQENSIMVKTL
ncbi:spermine/spermidine N-acetyltransferase [Gracilibacillus ureilyticus]|uniref:Spermine/spermidine N-acetyltransferase n=1 Tax=Gracilibacillus ureilyticus TaxID=531814 RepID=A0A1H9SWD6_9BACI|nr:GNAT family N-acetyltransferase [Gracilibacillus ureilyticus]SER89231.1 spermine/spermidine N-acetyltransferase [Gracilibacillus ureilyticus]